MSTPHLNEAPPAEAPKASGDFIRLEPFPKNDSHVLTVVAINYIEKCEFNRKDDNGVERIEVRPGLEVYFGTMVNGKPAFVKPWPIPYSIHEKANYTRWFEAATGNAPTAGTKPSEMVGKFVLGAVKNENKVGKKGTAYTVTKLATVSPVPSVLAGTGTDIKLLRPALDAILAGGDKKDEGNVPL